MRSKTHRQKSRLHWGGENASWLNKISSRQNFSKLLFYSHNWDITIRDIIWYSTHNITTVRDSFNYLFIYWVYCGVRNGCYWLQCFAQIEAWRHQTIILLVLVLDADNQRALNANRLIQISPGSYGPPTFCYRHTIYVEYNLLIKLNVYFSLSSLYVFFMTTLLHMMVYCHQHDITPCRIFAKYKKFETIGISEANFEMWLTELLPKYLKIFRIETVWCLWYREEE